MKIAVFGLGYVGLVTAVVLASQGHVVVGIDISKDKVADLNAGICPIVEPGLSELVKSARQSGRLSACSDVGQGIQAADLCFVCVGTPTSSNGQVETRAVFSVVGDIIQNCNDKGQDTVIVVRSTVPVGTAEELYATIVEPETSRSGVCVGLLFHPEFLREGSAIKDYYDPPRIVIGEDPSQPAHADKLLRLYDGFIAPIFRVAYRESELLKYCDNVFHALKIVFANEVGLLARAKNVNSQSLMEMFCADTKLNISEKYLRPGFAYGGSCLPKDLRGFLAMAKAVDLDLPVISCISQSNKALVERAVEIVLATGAKRIGLWGLAFKPDTDDLRESPHVLLAEQFIGKGLDVAIFDRSIDQSRLVGGNKAFVTKHLPHLDKLVVSSESDLNDRDLVVVGHSTSHERILMWLNAGIHVMDLAGAAQSINHVRYMRLT